MLRPLAVLLLALLAGLTAALPGVQWLTDANFERVTQAATGQTTGKW